MGVTPLNASTACALSYSLTIAQLVQLRKERRDIICLLAQTLCDLFNVPQCGQFPVNGS